MLHIGLPFVVPPLGSSLPSWILLFPIQFCCGISSALTVTWSLLSAHKLICLLTRISLQGRTLGLLSGGPTGDLLRSVIVRRFSKCLSRSVSIFFLILHFLQSLWQVKLDHDQVTPYEKWWTGCRSAWGFLPGL